MVSWKKIAQPKLLGGLGFRDLHKFNQALLGNLCWKFFQRLNSLVFKVLKSRYFKKGDFLSAKLGSRPSLGWQSILYGRDLMKIGFQRTVRNGERSISGCRNSFKEIRDTYSDIYSRK